MNYGLINKLQLKEYVKEVCDCLGYGANGVADELLLETAGVETHFGKATDRTIGAGMGITQIDLMPFGDIQNRVKQSDKTKIKMELGIDLDLVGWEHLRYNPFICVLFTRLFYKKIPEEIPIDMRGRAFYWKDYYNTKLGKGTVEHYMKANN